MFEDEPLTFAVFSEQADAVGNSGSGGIDGDFFAVKYNSTGVAFVGAENEAHKFGAAGAD